MVGDLFRMSRLVDIARASLQAPAVPHQPRNAGNTPKGFDCSGFIQWVVRESGLAVPTLDDGRALRYSYEFADRLPAVGVPEAGDLVLFSRNGWRASHIGIYVQPDRMIHSTGKRGGTVRESSIARYCRRNPIQPNGEQQFFTNPIGYRRVQ